MNGYGTHHGRRDLWLPALVVALGWALSLGVWWSLVSNRRQAILQSTAELADEARQLTAVAVESELAALDELADLWAMVGRRPLEHWQADVGMLIRSFPALEYVAWIGPKGEATRVSPGTMRPAVASPPGEMEALARAPQPMLVGPERDSAGTPSLRLLIPVGPDARSGVLAASVDLEALLSRALEGMSPGYALRIRWGDEEIFSRGEPSADPWQEWWRVDTKVELPYGVVWRVVHRPTPELAAARLTPSPHYLLASGALLSLLLAALLHQLRLTVRQSRFLAASNRALEVRGEELESRVAERTAELQQAVAELREFNQTVSHDLRSPLGAVLNFTTILEEDYRDRVLDRDGLAMLARIRRSASRATDLLEGLLQLSRAGRDALDIAPIDMTGLAKEIFAQVRVAEDDVDVELVVPELPVVMGDRALLGGVFSNLFTNALKYSRGCDKRRITVRGMVDADQCVFEVADTGRGFDMQFREKLFKLFERLHPDDDVEGTGVGLAIVERIVRRHGGQVWAESRPGEGARFSFSLPRPRGSGS